MDLDNIGDVTSYEWISEKVENLVDDMKFRVISEVEFIQRVSTMIYRANLIREEGREICDIQIDLFRHNDS